MAQAEKFNKYKYKNVLINAVIIIVALVIAFSIYNSGLSDAGSLKAKISEEEKKNSELEKINKIGKRIAAYKKLLVEREASAVMADISDIAKDADIKVLSIKPSQRESSADYTKDFFDVTINTQSFNALAKFISAIESYGSVYMLDTMDISSQSGSDKDELTVNLRISSIAATNNDKK